METFTHSFVTFVGTCVVLAWAIHEIVAMHEASLAYAPR